MEPEKQIINLKATDDLTTSETEEVFEEAEFEITTRSDYIACAYNAIKAVEELDTGIMSKIAEQRKRRIVRKSLRIIDDCLCEMYDELFEDDEED